METNEKCPRCFGPMSQFPALSRRGNIEICSNCGSEEAMYDYMTRQSTEEKMKFPVEFYGREERFVKYLANRKPTKENTMILEAPDGDEQVRTKLLMKWVEDHKENPDTWSLRHVDDGDGGVAIVASTLDLTQEQAEEYYWKGDHN